MISFHTNKKNTGFTLVEMLVTITIFVVLTAVVLFSQGGFNNSVILNNLAYDIGVTVRQAQAYGTNVSESPIAGAFSSYGVAFDISQSPTNFVLFADTGNGSGSGGYNPDGKYNGSITYCPAGDPECIQKYTINNGNTISAMCVGTDSSNCTTAATSMQILFTRPNPDATITVNGSFTTSYSYGQITVMAANGRTKTIVVTAPGQIYVQ